VVKSQMAASSVYSALLLTKAHAVPFGTQSCKYMHRIRDNSRDKGERVLASANYLCDNIFVTRGHMHNKMGKLVCQLKKAAGGRS
jgi:hypothetical protein